MPEEGYLPKIATVVHEEDQNDEFNHSSYHAIVYKILRHVLPQDFFNQKQIDSEYLILKSVLCKGVPGKLVIHFFGKNQKHALKFFIEMLSNWLLPGKRLNLTTVFSSEFCMPSLSSTTNIVIEVIININSQSDLDQIKINLPIIESEICLGMKSSFYAKRILEVKGLSIDAKTVLIHENIAYILERKPLYFDFDILTEMQHVLVICRDDFKSKRSSRHLSRIISVQYLFRRSLSGKQQITNKRQILLKIFRTKLQFQSEKKHVLGIIVGFNFLKEKEVFEKRHLMRAIQNHISNAVMVENSFFDDRRSLQNFCTLYLEIEKSNGEKFSNEEITKLRQTLPNNLLDGFEQLVHSVFMPRNEEEIMRNVMILSSEVKFLRDAPQVMITFDEQVNSRLVFTVIVVRILKPGEPPIQELFEKSETCLEYIHERCKTVGYLRTKHSKEATVFSVTIDKEDFIRRDHSIDLNKARQAIVFELLKIIGEFRDFNGGMISKQNELLTEIKILLSNEGSFNELLLENFFFSITPTVMRTVLEAEVLKTFFLVFQEAIEIELDSAENYLMHELIQVSYAFIIVKSEKRINRDEIMKALATLQPKSSEIATSYLQVHNVNYIGYLFRCSDQPRQEQFISIIRQAYKATIPVKKGNSEVANF